MLRAGLNQRQATIKTGPIGCYLAMLENLQARYHRGYRRDLHSIHLPPPVVIPALIRDGEGRMMLVKSLLVAKAQVVAIAQAMP